MAATKKNFNIEANGIWERTWQIVDDGVPVDLTEYTSFHMTVRNGKGNHAPIILEANIEVTDAENGVLRITIEPQFQITKTTTYLYDLVAVLNSNSHVWLEGLMIFDPGATYYQD